MGAPNRHPEDPPASPAAAGARAAQMLAEACRESLRACDGAGSGGPGGSTRLGVVRDLALDLGRQLGALEAAEDDADALVDAALACADLATLAACNLPGLSPDGAREAGAAVRLAADAVRGLSGRVEAAASGLEAPHSEYVLRDARSASWRAELAARQEATLSLPRSSRSSRSRGAGPG